MSGPEVALIATAVGVGTQAYSEHQAGKREDKLRKQNAAALQAQADREHEQAREQARQKRLEGQRLTSRQRVLLAKSGVKVGTGTPLLVQNETVRRIEQQAQIIQEHGLYAKEYGYSQAAIEKKRGKYAKRTGFLTAGSTLATGLGQSLLLKHQMG